MSKYEWESGTFTLPAAAVAPLKRTLRDYVNTLHDEVRRTAVTLHRGFATTSRSRYHTALRNEMEQRAGLRNDARSTYVRMLACKVLMRMMEDTERAGTGLRQPTVADVDRVAPRVTSATTVFSCRDTAQGYEQATISFDGRTVTYTVPENNHQRDYADETPLVQLFYREMSRIRWTRGTGGYTVGNDEYNRDSRDEGGGGNYLIRAYGPLGEQERLYSYMRRGFNRKQAQQMLARENTASRDYMSFR